MLVLFAVAMAYVESAAVLYLRTIYGGVDPVAPRSTPFAPVPNFDLIETGREAATMVMLACVGWLAGPVRARFWAFLVAFGTWDAFYYVFLWLFTGWPGSPLAPDVLFLIPLPWWGPVISPVLIAAGMVSFGGLAMARQMGQGLDPPAPRAWLALGLGAVLCLAAFMWGALQALPGGLTAAFEARELPFPWPVYLVGLALLVLGAWSAVCGRAGAAYEASSSSTSKA